MSEDAFNQPRKPHYIGVTDCVHYPPKPDFVEVVCPCGRIDVVAFLDCGVRGRIRAIQCRLFCDKYAQKAQTTHKDKD